MMKFLRKHNKKLLAVFMALLMIVFLGGSALDSWLQPDPNYVIANSRFGQISSSDRQQAVSTTQMLDAMGMRWNTLVSNQPEPLTPLDWLLLQKEIKEYGTARDVAAVRSVVSEGPRWESIQKASRAMLIRPERMVEAVAQLSSLLDTLVALRTATAPSESEVRTAGRLALDKAKIRAVVLPAAMFVDNTMEFSEQETNAQFEKYRDKDRGKGMEFGYRIPESARTQYIKIDKAALAGAVGVANLESKARKYYDENREKDPVFLRPEEGGGPSHEQPPEYIRAKSAFLDWDEAKDKAIQIIRANQAEEVANRISDWLLEHLNEPWHEATRGDDGYKTTPSEAATLDAYSKAIERLPASLKFPNTVSVATTDFFTRENVTTVPGIGSAAYRPERAAPIPLATLAFQNKAFVPKVPEGRGINPTDFLAPFQTSMYPLKDNDGNRYLFRVIEAKEAHPPATLAEVRERVIQDLRMIAAYKTAKSHAENLRACLNETTNLKQAFEADPDLNARKKATDDKEAGAFEPPPFPRMNVYQATHGRRTPATYINGVGFVPNEVVDTMFKLDDAVEKFGVYEIPDRSAVLAVEWLAVERGRDDEFQKIREQIVKDMTSARGDAVALDWATPEKIRARNQFNWVNEKSK